MATNLVTKIEQLLQILKLNVCLNEFIEVAARCEKENLTTLDFLYELLQRECEQRQHKKIEKLIKDASFPRNKLLSDFNRLIY